METLYSQKCVFHLMKKTFTSCFARLQSVRSKCPQYFASTQVERTKSTKYVVVCCQIHQRSLKVNQLCIIIECLKPFSDSDIFAKFSMLRGISRSSLRCASHEYMCTLSISARFEFINKSSPHTERERTLHSTLSLAITNKQHAEPWGRATTKQETLCDETKARCSFI